ncbi:MAG: hypothetical protein KAJ86_03490 [Alphaproteobacteria bacterium]|nr:hypothetical protein [Alphaproteobacteria bacterium]
MKSEFTKKEKAPLTNKEKLRNALIEDAANHGMTEEALTKNAKRHGVTEEFYLSIISGCVTISDDGSRSRDMKKTFGTERGREKARQDLGISKDPTPVI